jgi:hypothetical protein
LDRLPEHTGDGRKAALDRQLYYASLLQLVKGYESLFGCATVAGEHTQMLAHALEGAIYFGLASLWSIYRGQLAPLDPPFKNSLWGCIGSH